MHPPEIQKRRPCRPSETTTKKEKKRKKKKRLLKQTKNLWSQGGECLGILVCGAFPQT
jgi:hypothetical protein